MQDAPTPGGLRTPLSRALPLDTPFLVQIFPVYGCNFRCGYCIHALEPKQRGFMSDRPLMDLALFRRCVDQMKDFPQKLKMLRFAATGEPLLHPQIAEMVRYAKQAGIAESIDIVTNASKLTPALSQALIDAGLDRLRISVEGLSAADYRANAGATIDFDNFVENIRFFYHHCADTRIYVKIIDYMVPEPEDEKRFFHLFSPISHAIAVEHLIPAIEEIDYSALADGRALDKPQNGEQLMSAEVCPQCFYMMQVNPDGKVVPCCSMRYPKILGDVSLHSLPQLWTGPAFNQFRQDMLSSRAQASQVCAKCTLYRYDMHPEDVLDEDRDRLMQRYPVLPAPGAST